MNTPGMQSCVALIIASVVFAANANADLVTNGSFETPDIGNFEYSPAGSGWTFSPAAGIIDAPSGFGAPDPPPDGEQLGFLQVNSTHSTSSFSQPVSVPSSGLYTVTFFDAGRTAFFGGNVPYNVLLDSVPIHTDMTVSDQPFTFNSTLPFAVTAGSHLLEFRATHGFTGDNTAFFDSIQMQAIPEPSSAILVLFVLIGSGIVSYCVRRKQAQQQQGAAS